MEKADAIRKVRALEEQANSTQYAAESATYRNKAAVLRHQHNITDDDLADEEPGLLSGLFSHLGDPKWQKMRETAREHHTAITDAVRAAVNYGLTIENLPWRLDYFEDLYLLVRDAKDDRHVPGKDREIPGVRRARDRTMRDLFTRSAIDINNERYGRYDYRTADDDWTAFVKQKAIEQVLYACRSGTRQSSVEAALARVNGYRYFNEVLFPLQGCIDLSQPYKSRQTFGWQPSK